MRRLVNPIRKTSAKSSMLAEGIIIVLSILTSLLIQSFYDDYKLNARKEALLAGLADIIAQDEIQISYFEKLQHRSNNSAQVILADAADMGLDSLYWHLSSVGMGLRSFFPQRSPFDQLVEAQVIQHINSQDLRIALFKLFSEDLERHAVHTKEFDALFLELNKYLSTAYLLVDTWLEGTSTLPSISIASYDKRSDPLSDRKLTGMVIEAQNATASYAAELATLRRKYAQLGDLIEVELAE